MMPFYTEQIGLIGIDTGHKTLQAKVRNNKSDEDSVLEVALNTGISIVAPVWKIKDVLNDEELSVDRGGLMIA